ncbi:hypothetical protein T4B_2127 [Trichinella pseudospiralis]|uniref:Uncharacterized protein n=1 Tax=Trichinella pseudospiralis TaxID=6337 RepID=A0A0V1JW22_TRIPS|nr:hypothetical protein T4A_11981 [Trichinella pseudospiralis]KRZ27801.1 hypothetical protein T4B_2127 [Trichinella pseudospiralis]KRZ39177.1 hypothetical protein T4C_3151 [Trichinella pseudospiralis]
MYEITPETYKLCRIRHSTMQKSKQGCKSRNFVWRQSTWQILITLITLPLKPQMQSLLYYCCQKTHLSILMRINKIRKRSSVDLGSWFLTCKMKDYLA